MGQLSRLMKALLAGLAALILSTLVLNELGLGQTLLLVPTVPLILGAIAAQCFLSARRDSGRICPRCHTPLSPTRLPVWHGALIDGYTCGACKAQINVSGDVE